LRPEELIASTDLEDIHRATVQKAIKDIEAMKSKQKDDGEDL
jgi:hypothetical protein